MKKCVYCVLSLMLSLSANAEAIDLSAMPDQTYAPTEFVFDSEWIAKSYAGPSEFYKNTQNLPAGYSNCARLWCVTTQDSDDWLVSPEFLLQDGKTYEVSFGYFLWKDPNTRVDDFGVYMSQDSPQDQETASQILLTQPLFSRTEIQGGDGVWHIETAQVAPGAGSYHVSFHAGGGVWKGISVCCFSIKEYKTGGGDQKEFIPAPPSDLKAVAGQDHQLVVDLSWTNPAATVDGQEFTSEQVIEHVKIWRDDLEEPIATLEGDVTAFSDNEEYGLEAGVHTYAISVVVAGVESDRTDPVETSYVGPVAPMQIPWASDFKGNADEFADMWYTHYGESHSSMSGIWTRQPVGRIAINTYSYPEDAWLISPAIDFPEQGSYTITYKTCINNEGENLLQLGLVSGTEPEEYDRILVPQIQLPVTTSEPEAKTATFQLESPGIYHIAFRANAADHDVHYYYVYGVSVDTAYPAGLEDTLMAEESARVIEVYDIAGRPVAISGSLDDLTPGLYIVKSVAGDRVDVRKIKK